MLWNPELSSASVIHSTAQPQSTARICRYRSLFRCVTKEQTASFFRWRTSRLSSRSTLKSDDLTRSSTSSAIKPLTSERGVGGNPPLSKAASAASAGTWSAACSASLSGPAGMTRAPALTQGGALAATGISGVEGALRCWHNSCRLLVTGSCELAAARECCVGAISIGGSFPKFAANSWWGRMSQSN